MRKKIFALHQGGATPPFMKAPSRPDVSNMARSMRRRPIVVEHDRNHGHRTGRDCCSAEHRPYFEDGDDDLPPVILWLVREAPACHTHSEPPFGPPAVVHQQRESLEFLAACNYLAVV